MPTRYPKEQMHRIKCTGLTPEQITAKLAPAENGPTSAPLVEMARHQGGAIRRTDRGVLESTCVRHGGAWKFQRVTFAPTSPR